MKISKAISEVRSGTDMIAVLALGQRTQDHIALCGVFSHTNWKLYEADTRRKGLELVRQKGIRVVICETELPDGNWQVVLDELRDLSVHPQLVVSSHRVDPQLWGEVLNLGAYDLLPTPFEPAEVRRVVVQAWLASKNKVQTETGFHMLSGQVRVAAAQA